MKYRGPQNADYRNVRALNTAFLGLLQQRSHAARLLQHLPAPLQSRCNGLTGLQRERLATAPFLLFSLHEHDGALWDRLLAAHPNRQLFEPAVQPDAELFKILFTTLGFVWQLARDNTYAARVICGASLHWCEQLADRPLLEVVSASIRQDLLALRLQSDEMFWRKLLYAGSAGEAAIREAAHTSALQRLLTEGHELSTGRRERAASQLRPTAMKVADDEEH